MRKIGKYTFEANSLRDGLHAVNLRVPGDNPRALSVGVQDGATCIWIDVNPLAPKEDFLVYSVGTGHGAVPEGAAFIGTV